MADRRPPRWSTGADPSRPACVAGIGLDRGLQAIYIAFVEPIIVPPERLSAAALTGIIEAYVLREGTDYGSGEHSFASKCAQVRDQLARGDVALVYYPDSEQCVLVPWSEVPGKR